MLHPFAFKETVKSETLALGMQAQGLYLGLKLWTVKLGSEQSLSRDRIRRLPGAGGTGSGQFRVVSGSWSRRF